MYIHSTTWTIDYLQVITQQYTKKPPLAIFEQADTLDYGHFIEPSVRRLEIHHFSHHKSAALSLEGDNLCFTFKVVLSALHDSEREYEIVVAQKESVSSQSIQIQEVPISVPRGFSSSTDSTVSKDCQESEETARLHLFTHFGEFTFEDVEVIHKVRIDICLPRSMIDDCHNYVYTIIVHDVLMFILL